MLARKTERCARTESREERALKTPLTERSADQIAGVLSCYDRIVITGTLPGICSADGMAGYLGPQGRRRVDDPRFAASRREALGQNAEQIVREHGQAIELSRAVHAFRKADRIRNASLRRVLPDCSAPQGARLLRRLHLDGLIKKVGRSYTSDLTESGRRVLLTP